MTLDEQRQNARGCWELAVAEMRRNAIPIGAIVRITKRGHWAFNSKRVVCGLPRVVVGGIDLGAAIEFADTDWQGATVTHVVPVEWVEIVAEVAA